VQAARRGLRGGALSAGRQLSDSLPVARELLDFVPVAGWAVKGAIAYAGTRALGEAAIRYFEAGGARGIAGAATGHHAP